MNSEPMVHIPSFWGPLGSTMLGVLGFLAWFGLVLIDFPPRGCGGASASAVTAQEVREAEMDEVIQQQDDSAGESVDEK